jgi:hypothetical protein
MHELSIAVTDANIYPQPNSDGHGNGNSHSNSYSYSDCDCYSDGCPNANAKSDAGDQYQWHGDLLFGSSSWTGGGCGYDVVR